MILMKALRIYINKEYIVTGMHAFCTVISGPLCPRIAVFCDLTLLSFPLQLPVQCWDVVFCLFRAQDRPSVGVCSSGPYRMCCL